MLEVDVLAWSQLLETFAEALAPRLEQLLVSEPDEEDCWMDSEQAAVHLGMTKNAIYKLTSGRQIPFQQEGPGCKLFFRRSELDRWRRGERASD
jgi:hypothetical protein